MKNSTGDSKEISVNRHRKQKIAFFVLLGTALVLLFTSVGLFVRWKTGQKDCYDSCMTYFLAEFISGIITSILGFIFLISTFVVGLCWLCKR